MLKKSAAIGFSFCLIGQVFGEDSDFKLEPLQASAIWEIGQVQSYVPDPAASVVPGSRKHLIDHSAVWLLQEARLTENTKVFVGVGGMYFFIIPSAGNQYSFGQRSAFGLTDAHAEFEFWKSGEKDHGLLLKTGAFPFKYNEDAKNLGEYLFRTYTYPTVIYTGGLVFVNTAGVQLSGIDANTQYNGFTNDLLLTIKTDQVPSGALSLTEMASYTFHNIITVGGALMYDNFYDATGLAEGTNTAGGSRVGGATYFIMKDGSVVQHSEAGDPDASLIADTSHYSFVGTKIMLRAALDFGNLLKVDWLAEKDFRVYFETIIMGVKNYPGYYEKRSSRTAYLYGINLPTFKVLDMLSFELEYCSNPYADNSGAATLALIPVPYSSTGNEFNGDNVKWTAYAKKSVNEHMAITAQVADDHLRLVDYYGHTNDQGVLQKKKNWYWALQLSFSI
jgi:hypothetical protein